MSTVVNTLLGFLVLVVATWIAIFGATGALLARARDGSPWEGFAWGALLGPLGWLAVYLSTRRSRRIGSVTVGDGGDGVAEREATLRGTGSSPDLHEEIY